MAIYGENANILRVMVRKLGVNKRKPIIVPLISLSEFYDVIWRALNDIAELFNGKQSNIFIFFQIIESFIVNPGF